MKRLLLLLPPMLMLALFALGAAPGPQGSAEEALRAVRSEPAVEEYLPRPTVEPSALYEPEGDRWRVLLEETISGVVVARLSVEDGSMVVSSVAVSPRADDLDYPTLSENEAVKLAEANPAVREELEGRGSHTADADYEDGEWTVHFRVREGGDLGGMPSDDGTKEVARVGLDDATWATEYAWVGDQVSWQLARGDGGSYGKQANYWYVWLPLALVFASAFWRTDKLLSLRNLDVAAMLGFLVSHGFFRAGEVYPAVLLVYPPLVYLLLRSVLMGFGVGARVEGASNFPTGALFALGALSGGFVLALNYDSRVIDVGYASVVGADRIAQGILPYGNYPDDVGAGDTYGPLNYLFYVPFRLLFGYSGEWDYLPAAHWATVFAFVGCALALVLAGWRLAGARGGATLFFAWTVHPHTLYATNNNTNDVLVAMIFAVGLAFAASPILRGATVAAGFAVKLFPLVLAPLWMLHDGFRRRAPILDFVLGGIGVVVLSFWVLFLDGQPVEAVKLFYRRTFGFQGDRETPWTIFAQVPELGPLQQPLFVAAVLLALVVAVVPRRRTVRRLAAFSAAIIIAFQLTFNYWFYPYVVWFEPFVFVALLLPTNEKTRLDGTAAAPSDTDEKAEEEVQRGWTPRGRSSTSGGTS
jgi:hypothetical protein